jgi:PAS domain S-box-containing protein
VDRVSPDTGFVKHYSVDDGLAADFVVDSLEDTNGNLWFATNKGVSRLLPKPEQQIIPPRIFLGGLRIAGEPQAMSQLGATEVDQGRLSASQNNLQFEFFGLDFRAGESLRYQYKLEGADSEWSPPAESHTVTYANLQPASYRFLVRAVNSEGSVSSSPAVVSFEILPPIYARGWFIAICGLVLLAIIIVLERYRAARHRELSVSEGRFRSLVEQSPFGIMMLAPDGSIRSVNQAYADIIGAAHSSDEFANRNVLDEKQFIDERVTKQIERALTGETVKGSPILYDATPTAGLTEAHAQPAWLISSVYPVKDPDGKLLEVIAVLEDVTAQKTAEEQLARTRLERLIELEQVRGRIATDLHDDIGASLTQIAILSEVARQQTLSSNEKHAAAEPLSMIYNVSNELVGTMSDIVWSINPKKDQLHDLTLRMRRFAADVLSAKDIEFEFHEPSEPSDYSLHSNLRREVFLIFKEAINNIVKHSNATEVKVTFDIDSSELLQTIHDNGDGFDVGRRSESQDASLYSGYKGGNGLSSMRRRASEARGELEIISTVGSGTILRLRMPVAIQLDGDLNSPSV